LLHGRVDVSIRNNAGSTALALARNLELIAITSRLEEYDKSCLRRKSEAKIMLEGVELERMKKKSRREYFVA
jgi:hypothetical protein